MHYYFKHTFKENPKKTLRNPESNFKEESFSSIDFHLTAFTTTIRD